jgi:hypothetical protein
VCCLPLDHCVILAYMCYLFVVMGYLFVYVNCLLFHICLRYHNVYNCHRVINPFAEKIIIMLSLLCLPFVPIYLREGQ